MCLFLLDGFLVSRPSEDQQFWLLAIGAIGGALTLAGLWTPIAAGAVALLELWNAIRSGDAAAAHLLAAVIAGSLTVLGPGAWSVDARLFGRRRISMPRRDDPNE